MIGDGLGQVGDHSVVVFNNSQMIGRRLTDRLPTKLASVDGVNPRTR